MITNMSANSLENITEECPRSQLSEEASALLSIARRLQHEHYHFTTVTPDTHALVNARPGNRIARNLRDIFGWNRPFHPRDLPAALVDELLIADALDQLFDGRLRSRIRFSTIGDLIILHDGFPTTNRDAVFFGPDTYRFVRLLRDALPDVLAEDSALLEIGAGSGAASLCLKDRFSRLVMTDINPKAVRYAQLNAILAECSHTEAVCGNLVGSVTGLFDAIIANPPYLIDPSGRLYRDGGGLGIEVAVRMVEAGLPHLAPGGRLVLYTGAPVIDGEDLLHTMLAPVLQRFGLPYRYEVLDVDVFGSDLSGPAYAQIERIAVVALLVGADSATKTKDDDDLCVVLDPPE